MASPLRELFNRLPAKLRASMSFLVKAVLTVLAFYLLLSHKVQMVDHLPVQLDDTQEIIHIQPNDELKLGADTATLKNGSQAIRSDGTTVKIKENQVIHLPDGRIATVLPLDRESTFDAIISFLPKIDASTFWLFVLLAATIKFVGILSSMYRWHLLLQGQGIRFPFRHIFGSFLIGRFLGTFLPSTIGLDGYKLYDATRFSRRTVESTAATVIEKVLGIVGIFITYLVALPLGRSILGAQAMKISLLTIPIAMFGIVTFFTLLFFPKIIQFIIHHLPIPGKTKIQGFINRVASSASAYRDKKLLLVNAAFQSFMVHFCTAAMYFFTALAIGAVGATFWQVTFASSIQIFATVISPITIAGEGIREIAQYYLLRNQLGPAESIVSAALGFWAAEALTLFGGLFWWIRKKTYRPAFLYLDGRPADLDTLMKSDDYGLEDLRHPPESRDKGWAKLAFFPRLYAGFAAGASAGVIIGLVEAIWIGVIKGSAWDIYPYGMVMYGLVGAGFGIAAGAGMGIIALALGHIRGTMNTFALVFAGWLSVNILILGKFRLFRDIWKEQALPMTVKLALVAVAGVIFLVALFVSRKESPRPIGYASRYIFFALILIVAGMVAWGVAAAVQPEFQRPPVDPPADLHNAPNVVLIMLDALRADHLGCYDYYTANTPHIDALAGESVRFQFAYANSSWTKPGTANIFTGLYPSSHKTYLKPDILPDSVNTLAETMNTAGYYTIGFPNNINISPSFNFGQGFDEYVYLSPDYFFGASESSSQLTYYSILRLIRERFLVNTKFPNHYYQEAAVVNEHALEYLTARGSSEPFFMFLHYMEPHDPFFKHPFNGFGYARVNMPNPPPELAGEFIELYDEEISYVDLKLGELFREMKQLGLWDNTIVVLLADHGEEFFDHGGWWHGTTLYEEQIRIPLIIKLPNGEQSGSIRTDFARQIDIAPSVLELCGLPAPDTMNLGRRLFSVLPDTGQNVSVFAEEDHEGNVLSSLILKNWKYIRANPGNPRGLAENELFRLDVDPQEMNSLADSELERLAAMKTSMDAESIQAGSNAVQREEKVLNDDERTKLEQLGYLER